MHESESAIQTELEQGRPFHSVGAEVAVSILRTAAILERFYNQIVIKSGITIQQYNVLRILRGAGSAGLPTLIIRDRMVHEATGITRLIDRLEQSGLVRRERASPDRRQVFCYITDAGITLLATLDDAVRRADDDSVGVLSTDEQRELLRLLDVVRSAPRR